MCGLGGNGGVWMDGWLDGWYGLIRGICMEQQTNNFTSHQPMVSGGALSMMLLIFGVL